MIIFLTFFVIAVTLVGQGLSLPALIRKLKIGSDEGLRKEQQQVRATMSAAALDGLDQTPRAELISRLRHAAILAERKELIRLWRDNQIGDEVMHHLEEILDYQEAHL